MSGEANGGDRSFMLHAVLDGELDAQAALEMERALATDPKLAAEHAQLVALRQAIRTQAPRESAPDTLRARVLTAAASEAAEARSLAPGRRNERPSWRAFAAAMAATIIVTVGVERLIAIAPSRDDAALAVVAGHMRAQISGQPVDVASSDRHTVKPWLARKIPVAAMVVDLAPEGFELLGGRVDIVAASPAPTLVYKRREHLISVTELRADVGDYPAAPRRKTTEGYPVVVWKDGVRAYAAVSDIAPSELDAFVESFRKAAAKEQGQMQESGGGG